MAKRFIILTMEGGVIHCVEGIPSDTLLIRIDEDIEGADKKELTVWRSAPNADYPRGCREEAFVTVREHGDGGAESMPDEVEQQYIRRQYANLLKKLGVER